MRRFLGWLAWCASTGAWAYSSFKVYETYNRAPKKGISVSISSTIVFSILFIGGIIVGIVSAVAFLKGLKESGIHIPNKSNTYSRVGYSGASSHESSNSSSDSSSNSSSYENSTVSYRGQDSSYLTGVYSTNYEEVSGIWANSAYNVKTLQNSRYPHDTIDVKQATIADYDYIDSDGDYWKKV